MINRITDYSIMKLFSVRSAVFKIVVSVFLMLIADAGSLYSQTFSGRVVAEDNTPIAYANLYSRASGTGLTSDQNGMFSVGLDRKAYTFEVSSLGYQTLTVEIDLSHGDVDTVFVLSEQVYHLKGITVTNRDEDPACRIIRLAIASAARNKRRVSEYDVSSYVKGTGKVNDVPGFIRRSSEFRKDSADIMGSVFIMEGVYDVAYRYPDHYDVRTEAFQSSFPFEVPVNIWNPGEVDFFAEYVFGGVSPLGKRGFSVYDFYLEGYYMNDDGRMVNKIRVSPKTSSEKLVTGYIYIVEGLWCVSDVDFRMYNSNYSVNVVYSMKEVLPDIYLSASSNMKLDMSVLGVKISAGIFSSYNYRNIVPDTLPVAGEKENVRPKSAKVARIEKELSEIMSSDDITTSQAYRAYKLEKKLSMIEMRDTLKGAERYNLDNMGSYRSSVDSCAMKRDSVFWAAVRSVPLREGEIRSYEKSKVDTVRKEDRSSRLAIELLAGKRFYSGNRKLWIKTPGIDKILSDVNAVDGFSIGAAPELGVKLKNGGEVRLVPWAYYLTYRNDANYGARLTLDYAPMLNGIMKLEGGRETADYNGTSGYVRYLNTLSTYLWADNYARFYDNVFLRFSNKIELANGLNLTVGADYGKRRVLQNGIDRVGKKLIFPNVPESKFYKEMPGHSMLGLEGHLEYTPAAYYRIRNGRKYYSDSKFPTLSVSYKYGRSIDGVRFSDLSEYSHVEAGINHRIDFFVSSFSYWANAGMFINADNVFFPDFRHADVNPFYMSFDGSCRHFVNIGNYEYSTSDRWINGGFGFETDKLLLKWIPLMNNPIYREGIAVDVIAVPGLDMYTEFSYTFKAAGLVGFGVYAGMKGRKYDRFGFSFIIPLDFMSMPVF